MSEMNIREYPEGFRFGANEDIIVSSEVLSAYVEKLVLEAYKKGYIECGVNTKKEEIV